jgi:hypothetical protein
MPDERGVPEMTDRQAVQLLELLDLYVRQPDYQDGDSDDMTVRDLAQDLIGSLSAHQIPDGLSSQLD